MLNQLETKFIESIKKEMAEDGDRVARKYFKWNEKVEGFMERHRGFMTTVTYDVLDGSERCYTGTLGRTKKNKFILNIGDDSQPEWKSININKMVSIKINSKLYTAEMQRIKNDT